MKTLSKNNVGRFIMIVLSGIIICSLTSIVLTKIADFRMTDVLFVTGLILTIGSVFSMIDGRPIGFCVEDGIRAESKYISSGNIEVAKMDKEKLLGSVFTVETVNSVKSALLSTEFLTIGIVILATSFLL